MSFKNFVVLHITNMLVDSSYPACIKTTYNKEETPIFDVLSLGEDISVIIDSLPREGAYNYIVFKQGSLFEYGEISKSIVDSEVERFNYLNE